MDSKMKTMDCGESSSCATYTAGDADGGINGTNTIYMHNT